MATTVTNTVRPSGGDYTSLSAWEAGEQGDLTGVRDEIAVAECYAMSDTTVVSVDGWTTSATQYIRIYAPSTERAEGKWDATKYRLEVSASGAALGIIEDFVRIEGLQVYNTHANGTDAVLVFHGSTGSIHASHCVFRCVNGTTATRRRGISSRCGQQFIWNCIAINCRDTGVTSQGFHNNSSGGSTNYWYNNLAYNCDQGFQGGGSDEPVAKNNIAASCTTAFPVGWNWPAGSDYNTTNLALAAVGSGAMNDPPGANSRVSQTFAFVDAANLDFHLTGSDGGARDFGTDLSGDAGLAFSDDVDGQTRSGSWDMGPDEYVSGGSTTKPWYAYAQQ